MENLWIRKILLSVRGLVHELCKDSWLMNIFFGSGMVNPSWFIKIGGSARKNGHFAGKKAMCFSHVATMGWGDTL
jgi:hypothetical protein